MSTSIARKDKFPKQFPFSNRRKEMFPKKFDIGFHVTVLDKYSKKMPKRQPTALDRKSTTGMYWNDTRKFNKHLYTRY
tara:strand:+ start:353 stop:586 length:234 start_codon:yes stop_codon:yes gene_type:complete